MTERFDIEAARQYADRELQADDSYHAAALLAACDEIERLLGVLNSIIEAADGGARADHLAMLAEHGTGSEPS